MIVWRVIGNEIGPDGNGAAHFTTKAQALRRLREHRKDDPDRVRDDEPEKIVVRSREQLVDILDDAMGYGCS